MAFALDTTGNELGTPPGSAFSLGIEVDDLAALKTRLEASGANLQGFDSRRCEAIFVTDPDGNRVAFHHLKDASVRNP